MCTVLKIIIKCKWPKYYFNKYDIDFINGGLFYVALLLSYENTSYTLLDPMTDEGRANIKTIHCENYSYFFVYDSADRTDWIKGSLYRLIRLAE